MATIAQHTTQLPLMHAQQTHAMPVRNLPQSGTKRNLTGLYMGVDRSAGLRGPRSSIPPLARGRGRPSHRVKTPTEAQRYRPAAPAHEPPAPCGLQSPANTACYSPHMLRAWPTMDINIPHLPPMPMSRFPLMALQKKVEMLRSKEEHRGFSGQLPKRKMQGLKIEPEDNVRLAGASSPYNHPYPSNFWDMTKKTARQFTAATNSGVTHLEHLGGIHGNLAGLYPGSVSMDLADTIAQGLHLTSGSHQDVVEMVECYTRACKGDIEALQSLLPTRRGPSPVQQAIASHGTNYNYTGFTVKSYRTPNKAEILSTFPPTDTRPRTVIGCRPHVPSPYFFKGYNGPKTVDYNSDTNNKETIFAAPGAGNVSKNLSRGPQQRQNTPLNADTRRRVLLGKESAVPSHTTPLVRSQPEAQHDTIATNGYDSARVEISLPRSHNDSPLSRAATRPATSNTNVNNNAVLLQSNTDLQEADILSQSPFRAGPSPDHLSKADSFDADSLAGSEADSPQEVSESETQRKLSDSQQEVHSIPNMAAVAPSMPGRLERMPSGADIVLGLETDSGEQAPVEIDDTDEGLSITFETPRPPSYTPEERLSAPPSPTPTCAAHGRRVSITERVLKSKNSEQALASLSQSAEDRKQQLADLLTEHAEIVQVVTTMEEEEKVLPESPVADKENSHFEAAEAATQQSHSDVKH